jgi:HD superfamily phosphohydrolase
LQPARYSEKGTPIQPDLILKSAELWRAMKAFYAPLSFKDSSIKAALHHIYENQKDEPSWRKLKDADVDDWASVNSRRIMAQARGISQTTLKTPKAAWLRHLWASDEALGPAEADDDEADQAEAEEAEEDEEAEEEEEEAASDMEEVGSSPNPEDLR